MKTLMELETVKKAICQKDDGMDMGHHAYPSSHFCLYAKKIGEYVLERIMNNLYELLNDLGVNEADARLHRLQFPASVYRLRHLIHF